MQNKDLGVIVGKFQSATLSKNHIQAIESIIAKHTYVLIILCLSPCRCTTSNPLDFDTRRRMLMEYFPSIRVGYIEDLEDNDAWSKQLDKTIWRKSHIENVTIYGRKESFVKSYSGKHKAVELDPNCYISDYKLKESLATVSKPTADFRAGVIWAALNQQTIALPNVHLAIINPQKTKILLVKKKEETRFSLLGDFVKPGHSYEEFAEIIANEKLGIQITSLTYQKSFFIDDWQRRFEKNKITTSLFVVDAFTNTITVHDDIDEVRWIDIDVGLLVGTGISTSSQILIEYLLENVFI